MCGIVHNTDTLVGENMAATALSEEIQQVKRAVNDALADYYRLLQDLDDGGYASMLAAVDDGRRGER